MTSETLNELAERVEAATGPDRELDYAIHETLHGEWLRKNAYTREPGDDGWSSPTPPVKGANSIAAPQSYTASLDGAMTLKPEDLSATLYIHPGECHCDIFRLHPSKGLVAESEQAATPALALTAACLRARAAMEARNG